MVMTMCSTAACEWALSPSQLVDHVNDAGHVARDR